MAKKTKEKEPSVTDFFKPEEMGPLPTESWEGHWLIVRATWPSPAYR